MTETHYWSSSNLTPENIALVKYYHSIRVPMTQISSHTGLSLYYIRQIIKGINVPTNGKHRPTVPVATLYIEQPKSDDPPIQNNTPEEKATTVPIHPKVSPTRLVIIPPNYVT